MTLYGAPLSPFVRKVELCLRLKGIACARDPVTPFALPEGYERINPLKRIPALAVDGRYLADSAVICRFLEDLYPEPQLIPTDPWLKARTGWLEKFADYELAPAITATAFRHRVVLRSMGSPYDEPAIAAALAERAPPLYGYLEEQVDGRIFLVGDRLGLADIAVVSQFAISATIWRANPLPACSPPTARWSTKCWRAAIDPQPRRSDARPRRANKELAGLS